MRIERNVDNSIQDLVDRDFRELKDYLEFNRYFIFTFRDDIIKNKLYTQYQTDLCLENMKLMKKDQINIRYKQYNQIILTAGDAKQVQNFIVEERAIHGSSIIQRTERPDLLLDKIVNEVAKKESNPNIDDIKQSVIDNDRNDINLIDPRNWQ